MKGNLTMKTLKHKTLFFTLLLSMLFSQSSFAQYFLKSYDYPPFTTRTDVANPSSRLTLLLSVQIGQLPDFPTPLQAEEITTGCI